METRSLADFYRPKKFSDVIGQKEIVNCIRGMFKSKKIPPVILLSGPTGTGKAQPLSANILTPKGFVKMADVKVGDYVISVLGMAERVRGVYPQGIKKIYKVSFSDGTSTHCCEDHLWTVQTQSDRKNGKSRTIPLKEIMADSLYNMRSDGYKRWKYYIPISQPVQFNLEAVEDIQFKDSVLDNDRVALESYKDSIAATLGKWLVHNKIDSIANIYIVKNSFVSINEDACIPNYFLYNDIKVRKELLNSIIGDTEVKNGKVCINVKTEGLARDIVFLIRSLGGIANINNGTVIEAVIREESGDNKYLYKQIRNIEPAGEEYCQCIEIEDETGLYLTDDFIVTHNTTVARLIAKYVNCDTNNNCGKCKNCNYFESGNHPDISEINFADSRGIDDVRQYIKEATIMPSIGNKRIFIVDECHMLTPQAAQCLLKPLEDVPPNTVWLLVTMNPEKLNKAIIGRCFHLPFRIIEKEQLKDRLVTIFQKELDIEDINPIQDKAIDMIADISCGQVRFSLQLLESFIYRVKSGVKLTQDNVLNYLNTSSEFELDESAAQLVISYLKNNPSDIIRYSKSSNIRGVLYKMRFLIHYLLQNSVGVAQFRPYSANIVTKTCKNLDYASLNELQNRLISIEVAMNTTSIDENILFQTKLLNAE